MAEEKKGGFFKRTFGLKSKAEKEAERLAELDAQRRAVEKAAQDKLDAINKAAADNLARETAKSETINTEKQAAENRAKAAEKRAAVEAKETAQRQAQQDAADKKAAEAKAQATAKAKAEKAARLEAEKQEAEKLAAAKREAEKLETERLAAEAKEAEARAAAEKKAKVEKQKAERRAAEQLEKDKQAAERKEAARIEAEAQAAAKREAEKLETERLAAETKEAEARAAAEKKAAVEKQEAERRAAEQLEKDKQTAIEEQRKADQAVQEKITAEKATQEALKTDKAPTDKPKIGFFKRMSEGLKRSTSRLSDNVTAVFTKRKLDDDALEELEDLLIASDLGIGPSMKIVERLAKDKFDKEVSDTEIKTAMASVIAETLTPLEKPFALTGKNPEVILFVGVNGSGKTTTLGKMALKFREDGKLVLIAAGDTFRAAANQQLAIWAERAESPIMEGAEGADPAGLVFDAMKKAKDDGYEVVMIDTAGRLQNRKELMAELEKIVRVIRKHDDTAPHHVVLVLDATVGQNALSQTEAFKDTAGVTGLVMTKLDGTAKGGVLVALADKYKIPIHFIGIGEQIEDLAPFSAESFARALAGIDENTTIKAG